VKPAAAPIPSAQRGPKWVATQPTMGAPIGVLPSAVATRRAMTVPLIAGSVESCIVLLVLLPKVRVAATMIMRVAANHQYPGAIAARVQPSPKTPAPPKRDGKPRDLRDLADLDTVCAVSARNSAPVQAVRVGRFVAKPKVSSHPVWNNALSPMHTSIVTGYGNAVWSDSAN
jgi:hypothetical protein